MEIWENRGKADTIVETMKATKPNQTVQIAWSESALSAEDVAITPLPITKVNPTIGAVSWQSSVAWALTYE